MANLSLTLRCNQSCAYCFAPRVAEPSADMSWETFQRALEFLRRSGVAEARFLGGEPTLHPRLPEMIQEAIASGFNILLFSNGLFPAPVLDRLQRLDFDRFSVLLNVMPGDTKDCDDPVESQRRAMEALGPRIMLGLNIWQAGRDLGFLLDWVERYGTKRSIRLGLAHPSLPSGNRFLHPKFYSVAGSRIERLAEEASLRSIALELDCGFVPCVFSDSFRSRFPEITQQSGRRCNPILDILPGGEIISCYPLAALGSRELEQAGSAERVRSFFGKRLSDFQSIGIYAHCGSCSSFRERSCVGGCRSAAIMRLRPGLDVASVRKTRLEPIPLAGVLCPAPDRGQISGVAKAFVDEGSSPRGEAEKAPAPLPRCIWVLPYIDQPLEFWQRLRDDFGNRILEVYFPLPGGRIGSGRPPQPDGRLEQFLRSGLPSGVLVNPVVLPQPVKLLEAPILDALRQLRDEHGVRAATVANLQLAARIRDTLPDMRLTASVLMDICQPNQALLLKGVFDRLVPSSRIVRDLPALRALRAAFGGSMRLILNEGCLPGCPFRTQHFYEMATPASVPPESLCGPILERRPWLRLTGAWVLPQHLDLFEGVYDELKLAGRVTLRDPAQYFKVVTSYMLGLPLRPNDIGGGPACPRESIDIDAAFFSRTLDCGMACHICHLCEEYWRKMSAPGRSSGQTESEIPA